MKKSLIYITVIFICSVCFADGGWDNTPGLITFSTTMATTYPTKITFEAPTETTTRYQDNTNLAKYDDSVKKLEELVRLKDTIYNFVKLNHNVLIKEISRGEGETLNTLIDLLQCDRKFFTQLLKDKYELISNYERALGDPKSSFDRLAFVPMCKNDSITPHNLPDLHSDSINKYSYRYSSNLNENENLNITLHDLDQNAFEYTINSDFENYSREENSFSNKTNLALNILTLNNLTQKKHFTTLHTRTEPCLNNLPRLCKYHFSNYDNKLYDGKLKNTKCKNSSDCGLWWRDDQNKIIDYIEKQYPKED